MRWLAITCLLVASIMVAFAPRAAACWPPSDLGTCNALHVGAGVVQAADIPEPMAGVNRMGTEYECVQGNGFTQGPPDAASFQVIKNWSTSLNVVRVPLNQDCWLGINGAPAEYSGANYRNFIFNYVRTSLYGWYVILDLHWSTPPGAPLCTDNCQQPMPDMAHSVDFWTSVASTFKDYNTQVMFDLFNEPFPDGGQDSTAAWTCWRDGGTCSGVSYQVAGMQTLLNAVRAAGANNLVLLGGVDWSNSLSQWEAYRPTDPVDPVGNTYGLVTPSWHVYEGNSCSDVACYNSSILPLRQHGYAVLVTEMGTPTCDTAWERELLGWLDTNEGWHARATGYYLGWSWADGPSACSDLTLITDYTTGVPTQYGQIYYDWVQGR